MKKQFAKALASALSGALLLTAVPLPQLPAYAADCVIDSSITYQTIRGFGGMNLPEWIQQGDLTDAQRQTAFGNGDNELGLTILRIYVSDDPNAWQLAVPTAKFAQAAGATVFATPWNPPASIRVNGDKSFQGGLYHLPASQYGAYVKHLNDYYSYMKGQGVDVYSISVQNEPDYSEGWTGWTSDETTAFLADYGDQLNFRVMSPESFQYTNKDYYNKILNNPAAMANCDLFGTHFYGTQRSQMDFAALENCGKEIWMTEVYVPNSDKESANRWPEALQVSENIHNGLVVGNMSAYTWWYIRREYGLMTEDGKISKRGWNMAQFSKAVRPGAVRIDATESPANNVLISAYKGTEDEIVVVAINKNSSAVSQSFMLGSGETISTIEGHRTSIDENYADISGIKYSGSSFSAELPAESVSTFIIGGKEAEPDPDGYFFHDTFETGTDTWKGRGAAAVESSDSSAYAGSHALAVSGRTAAWNGCTRGISSSAFKKGEAYSFSVDVKYDKGDPEDTFFLKLEYTDAAGETQYSTIAEASAVKGEWVQLANTSYTIPEDANSPKIYVETADSTVDFCIDEAIGAPEGTKIAGPKPAGKKKLGDLNGDGKITAVDFSLARQVALGLRRDAASVAAADVDGNGQAAAADMVWFMKYLTCQVKSFPASNPDEPQNAMRTISEYTPVVEAQVQEYDPQDQREEKPGVAYGTVKKVTYDSELCKREKSFNILLPAGYSESKKYPVLYVMHGYYENEDRMILTGNGTMYTRQLIGNAIAEGEAEDMIVVFPNIYASATQDACSGMDDANNAAYDNFGNVLVKELMPYIESHYSVKTGRENTAITGFSMGGRESLLIGMQHADLFGYVGAICPAPGVTGDFQWRSEAEAPSLLFLTAGSNDTVVYSTPEGYHNNFTKNGVPHIWHYVEGGYHGDNCIHAHLYNFVRAVFKA